MIKLGNNILSPYLAILYNRCIDCSIYPSCLKLSHIIPIPKCKNPQEAVDYRPIALTPIFSKILEKILKFKLEKFLKKQNILTKHQFGFKKQHLTELAVASFYEHILNSIENRKHVCSVFLDLAKAFDTVDHNIGYYLKNGTLWYTGRAIANI